MKQSPIMKAKQKKEKKTLTLLQLTSVFNVLLLPGKVVLSNIKNQHLLWDLNLFPCLLVEEHKHKVIGFLKSKKKIFPLALRCNLMISFLVRTEHTPMP